VEVGHAGEVKIDETLIGAIVQYPDSKGEVCDFAGFFEELHAAGALAVAASDLLALTMLRAPGEFGADVVVGSSQRFGVPLGYGGPHAAFMAARETYQRQLPGRIIGVTRDVHGGRALRMALQTREQHIRREKATSNICTAQVLLAVAASFYGVYHGPGGLRQIAERVRGLTGILSLALHELGCTVYTKNYFDSLRIQPLKDAEKVIATAEGLGINLRNYGDGTVGVALDETVDAKDLAEIFTAFGGDPQSLNLPVLAERIPALPAELQRDTDFMSHPVFHSYHSETEVLRYMHRLQSKDLSLTTAMIPLGSCTMKLNATSEMIPITWPGFNALHPFAPASQAEGYRILHERLETWLAEITGFAATSLQPNAGSQGEYSGLLVIRAYHRANGQEQRDVCLIPSSAHGTNPASAKMAGMRVVVVACDEQGNIDLEDLRKKIAEHGEKLAALMVTYPSTHGVFEATIREICELIHEGGGQVYLDGANMNALVGLCKPGEFGADVCHLNLHKTFCIPHGGGGPGMGPICAAEHLAPFLPGHPMAPEKREQAVGAVSAAPFGSPSILPISYAYIALMGPDGLRKATEVAILNANYVAKRLRDHYPVLYTGTNDLVAHECILDLRPLKKSCGVDAADVAKRLMDYGFHAPTLSFPVAGTLMVEPTESESQEELDRFCEAMIQIRAEAEAIAEGKVDRENNLLKNAPHSAAIMAGSWDHPYSRAEAAYPSAATREYKFWPSVSRVDDVYGDRNLMCTCPPIDAYEDD
ncbi:MAG: aminomethyl-transferring glycine dehydrogenase, partial [Planctomycetota bacterium]